MSTANEDPAPVDPFETMNRWIQRLSLIILVAIFIMLFGGMWLIVFVYHGLGLYDGQAIPTHATLWENIWRIGSTFGILGFLAWFWYAMVSRLGEF